MVTAKHALLAQRKRSLLLYEDGVQHVTWGTDLRAFGNDVAVIDFNDNGSMRVLTQKGSGSSTTTVALAYTELIDLSQFSRLEIEVVDAYYPSWTSPDRTLKVGSRLSASEGDLNFSASVTRPPVGLTSLDLSSVTSSERIAVRSDNGNVSNDGADNRQEIWVRRLELFG